MSTNFDVTTSGQTSVRTVGPILPADLLNRVLVGTGLDGRNHRGELPLRALEPVNTNL